MSTSPLYVGMGPPYAFQTTVTAGTDFDPEAPTSAVIKALKPSLAEVTWTATIVSQDATKIVVRYPLAFEDLDEAGPWKFWVSFETATPGEAPRSAPFEWPVLGAYEVK